MRDVIGFENRVICGDGSVRWLQWNTRTVPERGIVFAVGRDVTDRRRADAELREAQRTVEASRDELARLAEEHAALRRVATLVAHGAPPEELFTAVVEEVERLLPGVHATLIRYAPDGTMTIVAVSESLTDSFPVGSRWPLGEGTSPRWSSRPAVRPGSTTIATPPAGSVSPCASGARSQVVGAPIVVEGRRWGVMTMASTENPLPPDSEAQLASFTELVATAIATPKRRGSWQRRGRGSWRQPTRSAGAWFAICTTALSSVWSTRSSRSRWHASPWRTEDDTPALLTEALDNAKRATDELRELAHGILPRPSPRRAARGIRDAGVADAGAGRDRRVRRPPPAAVEATAYFLVSEALTTSQNTLAPDTPK